MNLSNSVHLFSLFTIFILLYIGLSWFEIFFKIFWRFFRRFQTGLLRGFQTGLLRCFFDDIFSFMRSFFWFLDDGFSFFWFSVLSFSVLRFVFLIVMFNFFRRTDIDLFFYYGFVLRLNNSIFFVNLDDFDCFRRHRLGFLDVKERIIFACD